MKLIDKYLLREYLGPVLCCLLTFSMFFVILDLFDSLGKFLEARTPPLMTLRYYLCMLAPTMEFLAPASLLLGTLYTLWQLTRNNELTAMRASGFGLTRIMVPFLGVGVVFSLLAFVVRDAVAPAAGLWAAQFNDHDFKVTELATKHYDRAYYNAPDRRLWNVEELDLAQPNRLVNVTLTQERKDRSRERVLVADKAEYLDGEWWFFNVFSQEFDESDNPLGPLKPIDAPPGAAVTIPGLTETPPCFIFEVKPWEFLSASEMALYLRQRPYLSAVTRAEKRFDFHRHLAMPWACLIVTLFGIPAGARTGRQSPLSGVFSAMALFFGFYAVMQIGVVLGKREILPPWVGAWLANMVFTVAGLVMLRRMR